MLKIRQVQIEKIAQPALQHIKAEVADLLRNNYVGTYEKIDQRQLSGRLDFLLDDARKLGLSRKENVLAYLVLCLRFSVDSSLLLSTPSTAAILNNAALSETEKVYLLEEELSRHGSF
jgi:hypothetical protein